MIQYLFKLLYLPYRLFQIWYVVLSSLGQALFQITSQRDKPFHLGHFYTRLLERLGGTFIKVGQNLALRQDILPIDHCMALGKLMDEVETFSPGRGIKIIGKELKASNYPEVKRLKLIEFPGTQEEKEKYGKGHVIELPPIVNHHERLVPPPLRSKKKHQRFLFVKPEPVASASFSQVYYGIDDQRREIAIKVKRPWMKFIVFADLFFLRSFVFWMEILGFARNMGLKGVVNEISVILNGELDYRKEAELLKLSKMSAREVDRFVVPDVYFVNSTDRILTMEWFEGIFLSEIIKRMRNGEATNTILDPDGKSIRVKELSSRLYNYMMTFVFEVGYFHGDPHPGNILLMKGGQIGFVDYGIVGVMDEGMRDLNLTYLAYLANGEVDKAVAIFTQILVATPGSDFKGIKREMKMLLDNYLFALKSPDSGFKEKSSAALFQGSILKARKFRFQLRPEIIIYYKALLALDQTLLEIDPGYSPDLEARLFLERYNRDYIVAKAQRAVSAFNIMDVLKVMLRFPDAAVTGMDYLEDLSRQYRHRRMGIPTWFSGILLMVSKLAFFTGGMLFLFEVVLEDQYSLVDGIEFKFALAASLGLVFLGYLLRNARS